MSSSKVVPFSESDKNAVLKTYERTPEIVRQDIENMKEWLKKQPHLPEIPDDRLIETFLALNKFRIEKTKGILDMYYTVRSLIPEFYDKNPNDPIMKDFINTIYFLPLPKLTKDLARVTFIKFKDPDADFDAVKYLAYTLHSAEIRLQEDYSFTNIHIYDLSNIKFNLLTKFTPTILKKSNFVLEKVFSSRINGLHFINPPGYVDSFISIIKTLFKPKLAERIFVHKHFEDIYKFVSKDVLPKEYGGGERSLDELHDEWKKKFLEYDSFFEHIRGLKVNEKLRPGKPLDDDILGIHGNFRQLSVD